MHTHTQDDKGRRHGGELEDDLVLLALSPSGTGDICKTRQGRTTDGYPGTTLSRLRDGTRPQHKKRRQKREQRLRQQQKVVSCFTCTKGGLLLYLYKRWSLALLAQKVVSCFICTKVLLTGSKVQILTLEEHERTQRQRPRQQHRRQHPRHIPRPNFRSLSEYR